MNHIDQDMIEQDMSLMTMLDSWEQKWTRKIDELEKKMDAFMKNPMLPWFLREYELEDKSQYARHMPIKRAIYFGSLGHKNCGFPEVKKMIDMYGIPEGFVLSRFFLIRKNDLEELQKDEHWLKRGETNMLNSRYVCKKCYEGEYGGTCHMSYYEKGLWPTLDDTATAEQIYDFLKPRDSGS